MSFDVSFEWITSHRIVVEINGIAAGAGLCALQMHAEVKGLTVAGLRIATHQRVTQIEIGKISRAGRVTGNSRDGKYLRRIAIGREPHPAIRHYAGSKRISIVTSADK